MPATLRRARKIELLYSEECPSFDDTLRTLRELLGFFDIDADLQFQLVASQEEAEAWNFPGSPTIRIDGEDIDPEGAGGRPSLACRIYRLPDGRSVPSPTKPMLQRALKLHLPAGAPAPDFELPGVDGRTHALRDYADKDVVVLIQSCNHCPYVQAWEDRIIAFARDYAPRNVAVVAICSNDPESTPEDAFPEMVDRARRRGFTFDYLHDPDQSLAKALGATRTPEVFVFDASRRLVYHGAIDDNRDEPSAVTSAYLREAVDAALAGATPETPDTPASGCFVKWRMA